MATKTDDPGGHRDRRKNKGNSSGAAVSDKTRPPDKKKLEREVSAITKAIKEKEAALKNLSPRPTGEIDQLIAKLASDEKQKRENTIEVEKIEKEIKSLGPEVISKKDEASKLIAGVRHKTEEKIDEAVSKLELKLHTRPFSAPEERALRQEMESLKKSKEPLRAYYQVKGEIEKMRGRQESLRSRRDSLYRANGELRERIGTNKDLIAEMKALFEEKKKEALARKQAIEKEIDEMKQRRRQMHEEFRERQQLHSQAATVEREQQREVEKKQIESRRVERLHRKDHLDVLPHRRPRRLSYHEEKQACNSLIAYLEKLSFNHASNDTPPSPNPLRPQIDQSSPPPEKLGEFIRRKGEESEAVLIPAVSRKKSRRDKRRHAVSSKAGRNLNHNAITVRQFNFIGLDPPTSSSDLQSVLAQLHEKLTFYTSKSQSGMLAESEAGDSGVGSAACSEFPDFSDADLPTPLTISQEDISGESLPSPARSLSDVDASLKAEMVTDRLLSNKTNQLQAEEAV